MSTIFLPQKIQPQLSNVLEELVFTCPSCGKPKISKYYGQTMVGYFSPIGHDHNDNCRTFTFFCKDCHSRFDVRPRNTCPHPDCYWEGKGDDCGVCGTWLQTDWIKDTKR